MSSSVEIQSHQRARQRSRRGAAEASGASRRLAELTGAQGPLSPAARAALIGDPRFPAAVRRAARRLVDLHEGNRLLNLIVNDRGRMLVSLLALDLHFRRDEDGVGLTPGRLRQTCAATGTCSPARASALLALMRLGEFVRAAPTPRDRRRRELVPTEKLLASQRERWRCNLECAAPLLPAARQALAGLDDAACFSAMVREMCAYYYAGFRPLDEVPALRLFCERTGGMFVVLTLLAAEPDAEPDAEAAAGAPPVPVSVSHLARRIGTSRTHVIKLLADAAAAGLLSRSDGGGAVLHPCLREAMHEFMGLGILLLAHCAKRVRG